MSTSCLVLATGNAESGVVYTYTTEKCERLPKHLVIFRAPLLTGTSAPSVQPIVTQDVGKNMIAACLVRHYTFPLPIIVCDTETTRDLFARMAKSI
jgi:hypothetical protein